MSHSDTRINTFIAGADLSARQYSFVKFGADNLTVALCELNERSIGILQNAPISGGAAEVALPGGGAYLKIGAAVQLGRMLTSDATGRGTVADAANEWCGALAYQAGVLNDVIAVEVLATKTSNTDVP